jgi:hypothetical protein
MKKFSALRFFLLMCATAAMLLAIICLLPHDRYLRFQSLTDPAVVKASWIFERIHFDPAPMDVLFVGTSHSVFGIDSAEVERECRSAGGQHCASVNFALQHLGRDLHWLIAREALDVRKPRLLIIEVQETEPRAMHPAFPYLADTDDIIGAPIIINTTYFSNLAHLPLRQVDLWTRTQLPVLFYSRTAFSPALYRGSHWDDTYAETGSTEHPISNPRPRTGTYSAAELEFERAHPQSTEGAAPHLPGPLHALEYRATLSYLDKLINLAHVKDVPVRFLYMPSYGDTQQPEFAELYRHAAPMWEMPQDIRSRPELWLDVGHLNNAGAAAFSRWLGEKIAKEAP